MPTITTNQGLTLPATTDADNVPVSMADYNGPNGVENRLVQRYLSVADRTARNPAPTEGELSYLTDLNRYDTYNGAAWVPLYPQTVFAAAVASYTTASGGYTTAGAALLGVTLVVPNSGQVRIDFGADLDHSTNGITFLAPQLNTGAVVGAGAVIVAASDDIACIHQNTDQSGFSNFYVYTGLTPGVDVNVFLNHRTNVATATIARRKIGASQA